MISGTAMSSLFETLEHWWSIYSIVALLVSFLFFMGFIYAKIRYSELCDLEQQMIREAEATWTSDSHGENNRWVEILKHSTDDDPNAWRIAIIEADIMLEETLANAGYIGATVGDKLKTANPSVFTTIEDAWEAHKIRNEIAHAGSDFVLTKRITQEIIMRFERVFKEFGVI